MGIDVIFPLTLALSPEEREQRLAVACLPDDHLEISDSRNSERRRMILPLLRGEGRGEGQAASFTIYPDLRNFIYGH
jgi:hypothetical protein